MKKILVLFFAVLFLSEFLKAQNSDAKILPLQVGHSENVNEVLWSPDNTKILSHSSPDNSLRLWDAKTGRQIWAVNTAFIQNKLETYTLNAFAWSADQKLIASTGYNGKLQLWDAETGKLIWIVDAHSDEGQVVRFSPNGELLISTAQPKKYQGEIKLWNVKTGELVRKFTGSAEDIIEAEFSHNGEFLTTGSSEGEVSVWKVADGSKVSSKKFNPCGTLKKYATGFGYSPNLKFFAGRCSEKTVVTNTQNRKVVRVLNMRGDYEKEVGFSRDGKILALTDVGFYKVVNLSNNQTGRIEDVFNSGFTYELNNDGSLMAEGGGYSAKGIQITDVKTGKVVARLESHPGIIKSLAFNAAGNLFASGGTDRILRIWDAQTGQMLLTLSGHTNAVNSINFDPDGKTVTSKSEKETIAWNVETGEKLKEEKTGTEETEELKEKVVSPIGNYTVEDSGDEKPFQLTNIKNGSAVQEFSGLTQIQGFKFTPNEKQFLSAAYFQPLQLWDIESGRKLRDFDIGYSHSNIVTFSPDGKSFITGGWNQNILMYELETGKLLWSLFPIDQLDMQAHQGHEAQRVKYLQDKADYEKRADIDNQERAKKITAKFSHYGTAESFWDQKIAESGTPNKSKLKLPREKATVAWVALTNDADLPVAIDTNSMIFNPKCKGLCDGAEISLRYVMELKSGETRVNGFDMFSKTVLPPRTTVYFSVALDHFAESKAIYLGFIFQKDNPDDENSDDYGTEQRLYVQESKLP